MILFYLLYTASVVSEVLSVVAMMLLLHGCVPSLAATGCETLGGSKCSALWQLQVFLCLNFLPLT